MRLLKNITKLGWALFFVSIGLIVGQVWLDLRAPEYMQKITFIITEDGPMSDILLNGLYMLLCCLGSFASAVTVAIFSAKISSDFSANMRSQVHSHIQTFSINEIKKFSTASLITRTTNDVTQVQSLIVMGLQSIIKAPVLAVMAVVKISATTWQWTLSVGLVVLFIAVVMFVCLFIALPKFRKMQQFTDGINRATRENLNGLRVVRAYNAESYQENKFAEANRKLTNNRLFANRTLAFMMPSIQLALSSVSVIIYWTGTYIINAINATDPVIKWQRAIRFGQMTTFMAYAMSVIGAFMMLVMIFMILPRALVSLKRINEVLDTKSSIIDGAGDYTTTDVQGEIEFKNVSFRYPDAEENALHDITFSAHKGETVALIGSTGCGKSSVINLIPRFYDVTDGEVLVDGINVKDYTQRSLHNKIAYISQRATLFYGDIKSNIDYGAGKRVLTEADIDQALATAQAGEFVNNLAAKTSALVAQNGTNYSGGQKQRLSIARALARDAEIIIFDDSFSALDYATDKKLRQTLREQCADATKIIVAQRIGTIRDADNIIVLENGKIVGQGKHNDLMKNCPTYKQIALSQLSHEEALA